MTKMINTINHIQNLIIMKRLQSLLIAMIMAIHCFSQENVIKFLDIPIDGSKTEMKKKLISKGFTYKREAESFFGEFNGQNVWIHIVTNRDKVWRLLVIDDVFLDKNDIKTRFNNLSLQFYKNKKYKPANFDESLYTIPDTEDIEYEMLINAKRYENSFFQSPDLIDSITFANKFKEEVLKIYSEEELAEPTKEIQKEILSIGFQHYYEEASKRMVWFMIHEEFGKYRIVMYYDNGYNRANGEEL